MFAQAYKIGLEDVVSKVRDSAYLRPGQRLGVKKTGERDLDHRGRAHLFFNGIQEDRCGRPRQPERLDDFA